LLGHFQIHVSGTPGLAPVRSPSIP
jgi:hypothetical protein